MRIRLLFPMFALIPLPLFAQEPVVTSLPRPALLTPVSQDLLPPPTGPFIPPPEVPPGPPTVVTDVFTRPERKFAFSVDSQLLFPAVYQRLQTPIDVPNYYTDMARLPFANLGLAGAFQFNLRTKALGGEVGVTYRFLAAEGCGVLLGFDPTGDAAFRSRMDMNVIDFNYYTPELAQRPQWTLQGQGGVRLASLFFDSQASGAIYDRKISNNFFGAGPHAGLRLSRALGESRFAIFGQIDGGAVIGSARQQFRDMVFNGPTMVGFGYAAQQGAQGIPILTAELGLGTAPGAKTWGHWQIGYRYEQWWAVGGGGVSQSQIVSQGMYARWIIDY